MKLQWFLSAHDSVDQVISNKARDDALEINNMKPIIIEANSIEKGFEIFYNSKEFNEFADNSFFKTLYWHYYNDQGGLFVYSANIEKLT